MSTVTRSNINYLLQLGVDTVFGLDMREEPEDWLGVYEKRNSMKDWEENVMMAGPGWAPVFGEDEPISYGTMKNSWVNITRHQKYGLALRISEEAKEDNLYMQMIAKGGRGLARSMKSTRAARAAEPLNRATDTNYTYGDGKPLLALDHPLDAQYGGSFANMVAGHPELSESALEDMLNVINYFVSNNGLPANFTAKRLAIAKALKYEAHRILHTIGRVQTADNDTNAIRDMGIFSDPVELRYIANRKQWGITTDGGDGDGLVFYERWAMRRGEDTDFETGSFKYKCVCRDSFTVEDPRGFAGSYPA